MRRAAPSVRSAPARAVSCRPVAPTPRLATANAGPSGAGAPRRPLFSLTPSRFVSSAQNPKVPNELTKPPRAMDQLYTPAPAIELIMEEPPIKVKDRQVWCNGGGGPLGHPRVFIPLDSGLPVPCGYCGLRYEATHHDDHH